MSEHDKEKQEELNKSTKCEVVNKTKYLGVNNEEKYYLKIIEKLGIQIDKDMIKWNSLNLSLMGRIKKR